MEGTIAFIKSICIRILHFGFIINSVPLPQILSVQQNVFSVVYITLDYFTCVYVCFSRRNDGDRQILTNMRSCISA
jgi:hypothetical protein